MKNHKMNRRLFIKNTTLAATALTLTGNSYKANSYSLKNKLPGWKGFNLLDYFSPELPGIHEGNRTTEDDI